MQMFEIFSSTKYNIVCLNPLACGWGCQKLGHFGVCILFFLYQIVSNITQRQIFGLQPLGILGNNKKIVIIIIIS